MDNIALPMLFMGRKAEYDRFMQDGGFTRTELKILVFPRDLYGHKNTVLFVGSTCELTPSHIQAIGYAKSMGLKVVNL